MSTLRLSPWTPRTRAGVFAFAGIALATGAGYVFYRGGISEVLQRPAVLADDSSAVQRDMELLDVSRVNSGDPNPQYTGEDLGVAPPPYVIGSSIMWFRLPARLGGRAIPTARELRFVCKTSVGETNLEWHVASLEKRVVYVQLPTGYAGGTQALEVSAQVHGEPDRTWRLTRLPVPHLAVPGPASSTFSSDVVSVSGSASVTKGEPNQLAVSLSVLSKDPETLQTVAISQVSTEWSATPDNMAKPGPAQLPPDQPRVYDFRSTFAFAGESQWVRVKGIVRGYSQTRKENVFPQIEIRSRWLNGTNTPQTSLDPVDPAVTVNGSRLHVSLFGLPRSEGGEGLRLGVSGRMLPTQLVNQADPVSPRVVNVVNISPEQVPAAQVSRLQQLYPGGEVGVTLNDVRIETASAKQVWSREFDLVLPIQRR